MSDKQYKDKGLSRRGFLKGAAVAAGGGLLPGAASTPADAKETKQDTATAKARVPGYCGEGDWLGAPPVIPDSEIQETITVDVLVIGGGHAGTLAALGASDKGVKVAVIEKMDEAGFKSDCWHYIGEDIGHVNSRWLMDRGYGPYDTGEITAEFVRRTAGRCNPEVLRLYVENSGAMFDRMCEAYEAYGARRKADDSAVEFTYSDGVTETFDFSDIMDEKYLYNQIQKDRAPGDYPIEIGGYKTWPCTAQFGGPVLRRPVGPFVTVLRWFEKYTVQKAMDNGADWYYQHTAAVLTQDKGGAVTGALVKNEKGKYVRFAARKGVIVATGDFSGNADMCWALLNETMEWAERGGGTRESFRLSASNVRNGHGHKMCCWAGGMIEPSPRGYMAFGAGTTGPWGISPMLQLNARARRFCNEAAAPIVAQQAYRQPIGPMCVVTDRKYLESIVIAGLEHGGPNFGRMEWFEDMQADMAKVVDAGAEGYTVRGLLVAERNSILVFGANTLEELAGFLGYSGDQAETFIASIERYNELCRKGKDSDFGKDAKAMIPIDEPPFYGCRGENQGPAMFANLGKVFGFGLTTFSGLMTDHRLRVLDRAGNPIEGLFVAGNTLGGRYGLGYSTPITGNSIGMAMTHGWLAGKFAADA